MKEEKDEIAAIAAADAAEETETDGAEEQPMKTPIKKTTSKPAKSPGTPGKITYIQMVTAAIIALKDRTGSSLIAIKKYILANNPGLTPAQMKLNLNKALKSGVKAGRLLNVKS
jgi:histone H1/5